MHFLTSVHRLYSSIRRGVLLGKTRYFFMAACCPSLNLAAVPLTHYQLNPLRISMKKMSFFPMEQRGCRLSRSAVVVKSLQKEELAHQDKGAWVRFKSEFKRYFISIPAKILAVIAWGLILMIPAMFLAAIGASMGLIPAR